MPGLVIGGKEVAVDGLQIINFLDDASIALHDRSYSKRRRSVRFVMLHTTKGYPDHNHRREQSVVDVQPSDRDLTARRTIAMWQRPDERVAGAHIVIDADGTVYCCADLQQQAAYHCHGMNQLSIGIEVSQQGDASLFRGQLVTVGLLCDALVRAFELPRCVALPYRGCRVMLADDVYADGLDGVSVCGHRDASENRGAGDPGDFVMAAAMTVGEWTTG